MMEDNYTYDDEKDSEKLTCRAPHGRACRGGGPPPTRRGNLGRSYGGFVGLFLASWSGLGVIWMGK